MSQISDTQGAGSVSARTGNFSALRADRLTVRNQFDAAALTADSVTVADLAATSTAAVPRVPDVTLEPVQPAGNVVYNEATGELFISDGAAWKAVGRGPTTSQTLSEVVAAGPGLLTPQTIRFPDTGEGITFHNSSNTADFTNAYRLRRVGDRLRVQNLGTQTNSGLQLDNNIPLVTRELTSDNELDINTQDGLGGVLSVRSDTISMKGVSEIIIDAPTIRLIGNVVLANNSLAQVITDPSTQTINFNDNFEGSFIFDIVPQLLTKGTGISIPAAGDILNSIWNGDFPNAGSGGSGKISAKGLIFAGKLAAGIDSGGLVEDMASLLQQQAITWLDGIVQPGDSKAALAGNVTDDVNFNTPMNIGAKIGSVASSLF